MTELWLGEVAKIKRLKKLTNKDIAEMTGYSEIYIRLVISGTTASDKAKKAICTALGIKE